MIDEEWQVPLWDAINRYVVACGGDPSKHVHGNLPRMDAVVQVNTVVRTAESARIGRLPTIDIARARAALEEIAQTHPALVMRDGGPAPWLIAKAALLNMPPDADAVVAEWAKTEPRVRGRERR